MADRLTDTRLAELAQVIQDFHDRASFDQQQATTARLREQMGPGAFTSEEALALVREVLATRSQAHDTPTVDDLLAQARRGMQRSMGGWNATDAEKWARIITTLLEVKATPARSEPPRVSGPGLKQETLAADHPGAEVTCAEPGCTELRGAAARFVPDWRCSKHRWDSAVSSRVASATGRVYVTTRTHDADQPGRVVAGPGDWERLNLPTTARLGIVVPLDVIRPVLPWLEIHAGIRDYPDFFSPPPADDVRAFVNTLNPKAAVPLKPEGTSEMVANATLERLCFEMQRLGSGTIRDVERSKAEVVRLAEQLHALALGRTPAERERKMEDVANAARDMHVGVEGAQQRLEDALRALDGEAR